MLTNCRFGVLALFLLVFLNLWIVWFALLCQTFISSGRSFKLPFPVVGLRLLTRERPPKKSAFSQRTCFQKGAFEIKYQSTDQKCVSNEAPGARGSGTEISVWKVPGPAHGITISPELADKSEELGKLCVRSKIFK